jgi:hypothetical protein
MPNCIVSPSIHMLFWSCEMSKVEEMLAELKQKRDELEVQARLGSMEAKQQWEQLEKQWNDFAAKAEVEKTAEDVSSALDTLGGELTKGYERLRKAL